MKFICNVYSFVALNDLYLTLTTRITLYGKKTGHFKLISKINGYIQRC